MIVPDGVIHGLVVEPEDRIRLWDYDPKTALPIEVQDQFTVDTESNLRIVFEDAVWGSMLTLDGGIDVLLGSTLGLLINPDEERMLASTVRVTFDLFGWTGVTPTGQFAEITTAPGLA